jgi:hypothetical protein
MEREAVSFKGQKYEKVGYSGYMKRPAKPRALLYLEVSRGIL